MRLVERAVICREASVKLILMLKVIDYRAVDLRQRETGKVSLYLFWRLAPNARCHNIAQQHTALANEEITVRRTYQQISIHQSPSCPKTLFLFLNQLCVETGALALFQRPLHRRAHFWADTQLGDYFPRCPWRQGRARERRSRCQCSRIF